MRTYKCGWTHCDIAEPVTEENGEVVGKRHYHKDCARRRAAIDKAKESYMSSSTEPVVVAQLMRIINDICFKHKVDPEQLLFAIKYAQRYNMKLYPSPMLYYIIKDDRIKKAYNKAKARKLLSSNEIIERKMEFGRFNYTVESPTGFSEILR